MKPKDNSHGGTFFFCDDQARGGTSGPVLVMVLAKENAVAEFRKLIGNTNPRKAGEGTIRNMFAESLQKYAIHGSDSDASAQREADFFFPGNERFPTGLT